MTRFLLILQFLFLTIPAIAQDDTTDVVIGQARTLESEILGETRAIKVWLPENYADSGETYPTFYLLDAEMVMRFAKAAATVAELGGRAMPEMIVVGIDNIDRNKDMFPAEGGGEGGADKFLDFLTRELFPFVEKQYRTSDYRILTGHSNSALFVSYALLKQPEAFNAYFAISPMLGHREQEMLTLARQSFASFPQRNTFLYIEYGEYDFRQVVGVVPDFVEILEKSNPTALSHRVDVVPGEGHVPYSCYRDALVALFADFRIKAGDLGQGVAYIETYYQNLSKRYGFEIKTPAEPMLEYGKQMLDAGENEKAIEALKLASVRYPSSASAHYRLGQAYEASGKFPEAVAAFQQVLQIYPQSNTIQAKISELEKSIAK